MTSRIGWTGAAVAVLVAVGVQGGETTSPAGEPALAKAKEHAQLMHDIYSATLTVTHRHYFRPNHPVLPSRAMEDIFANIESRSGVKARWISVNTKAMSVNHEPSNDFEKRAAAALSSGKTEYEAVEDGVYRRAGAIPLASSCVSCHTGFFAAAKTPTTPRVAALVISVPLTK